MSIKQQFCILERVIQALSVFHNDEVPFFAKSTESLKTWNTMKIKYGAALCVE